MTTRFTDHLLTGDHASRPAASAVPQGTLYSCTTHGLVYQSDGVSAWSTWATLGSSAVSTPDVCCGRLTLESGVAISTSDQTAKTTVYWTPYRGARIALYDGASAWTVRVFSETSLALGTLTSGKNYDVFGYDNSGTLALEALAWTNDTTRATALVLQDGVLSKTGALTRRYLGTFRTTSTTTTEDSKGGASQSGGKRFLWNFYNRVARDLAVIDTTNSWTWGTDSWQQANAAAGNKVEFVVGVVEDSVTANLMAIAFAQNNSRSGKATIILNSTSTPVPANATIGAGFDIGGGTYQNMASSFRALPGLGYNYLAWCEKGSSGGTFNFIGDNNASSAEQSGMNATVIG